MANVCTKQFIYVLIIIVLGFLLINSHWLSNNFSRTIRASVKINCQQNNQLRYRRQSCSCTRPMMFLNQTSNSFTIHETEHNKLCSQYSALRGYHQRVISISMYGPRENGLFTLNRSVDFLRQLIDDMKIRYPTWILRVYHDSTIDHKIICPIECDYNLIDFCNVGSLSSYIPAKIWRFLPVGDELVDIMASRDLDSPLSQREFDAVHEWIDSNKTWHAMRDNPMHYVPMLGRRDFFFVFVYIRNCLGGMWGFRSELNRTFASQILQKILDRNLVSRYGGRGDQRFLSDHIWPHIADHVIAHDSFLCNEPYGKRSVSWPTRRPHPTNDSQCFVGCVRPCCNRDRYPFQPCPMACRPKNHPDWEMC